MMQSGKGPNDCEGLGHIAALMSWLIALSVCICIIYVHAGKAVYITGGIAYEMSESIILSEDKDRTGHSNKIPDVHSYERLRVVSMATNACMMT
jgi:hypothetical protein